MKIVLNIFSSSSTECLYNVSINSIALACKNVFFLCMQFDITAFNHEMKYTCYYRYNCEFVIFCIEVACLEIIDNNYHILPHSYPHWLVADLCEDTCIFLSVLNSNIQLVKYTLGRCFDVIVPSNILCILVYVRIQ